MLRRICCRYPRNFSTCRNLLLILFFLFGILYIILKIILLIDYHRAQLYHQIPSAKTCRKPLNENNNKQKLILFWTKIFTQTVNAHFINNYFFTPTGRCQTDRCKLTINRQQLCQSHAVIFHARGGIRTFDMPPARLSEQRYVLVTKEPPYKTSAIVGYLNYFFNWTATYRVDSDINYRYFQWRRKDKISTDTAKRSYLDNRSASAAVMVSNCYSENNREEYIERLNAIIPVTRLGHCSRNKCHKTRFDCLNDLADQHPFYLSFENSLCNDYVTEKYANVILNGRLLPIVFSKSPHLYIPNSFIDANEFLTPEHLGQFLQELVKNTTKYDSYFKWKDEYELIVPDEYDYLCELCQKLHKSDEPPKIYNSMKKWLYEDAQCQRWESKLNKTVDVPVDETMDYDEPWF